MASKQYDRTKLSVYLDHSTLCAAFKAHRPQADAADFAAYRPLVSWAERVGIEANLCLSTAHLIELVSWEDTATADAKTYGLIIDYWGVSEALQEALAIFSPADVKGAMLPKGNELPRLQTRHAAACASSCG